MNMLFTDRDLQQADVGRHRQPPVHPVEEEGGLGQRQRPVRRACVDPNNDNPCRRSSVSYCLATPFWLDPSRKISMLFCRFQNMTQISCHNRHYHANNSKENAFPWLQQTNDCH
jgi:hypothetical protein